MKDAIRFWANRFLRTTVIFARGPFMVAWAMVRWMGFTRGHGHLQLSWRNSYALGYYEPLYSDIDITVVTRKIHNADLDSFVGEMARLREKLPIFGEINIYDSSELTTIADSCNYYELLRDPVLRKAASPSKKGSDAEKVIFLIKMLEADYKALKLRPSTRRRKWNSHFQMTFGQGINEAPSLALILQTIENHLPQMQGFKDSLLQYFSELESGEALHLVAEKHLSDNPWWWSCFPNRFCFLPTPTELNGLQRDLMVESLRWELWGLTAQQRQLDLAQTRQHLLNLRRLISEIQNQPESQKSSLQGLLQCSLFSGL